MSKKKLTLQQAMIRAKSAYEKGEFDIASNIFAAILKKQPGNKVAKGFLQKIEKDTFQNPSEKPKSSPPSEQTPSSGQATINMLIELYNQGDLLKVETECRRLLKVHPKELTIINLLGASLTKQMKYNEAVATYKEAIQLNPSFTEAYLNLATALKELGRNGESAKNCKKAIKLNPDFAEAHCVLGEAQNNLEQPKDAIKSFKKALLLKPGFSEACIGLGNIYLRQGLMEKGLFMKRRGQHVICFDPSSGVSILGEE